MATPAASPRILVAGLGNVFLGDDGFGVEVVRRLTAMPLPEGVRLVDVGLRSLRLAYELCDAAYDGVIFVDAASRGGDPGTLYVLQPEDDPVDGTGPSDGHAIAPHHVLGLVRRLGGRVPPVLIVACEASQAGPDAGLSPAVATAVGEAARLVQRLLGSPMAFTKDGSGLLATASAPSPAGRP